MLFAAVGDVHGQQKEMVRLLKEVETEIGQKLNFVLQVGDFEPIRYEEDLRWMAVPSKYRKIGDFPDFFIGKESFPWPVYVIGGNHEPYGFLESMCSGGQLTQNCTYLGRVGWRNIHGLRMAWLSGIYSEGAFTEKRPKPKKDLSPKALTYFTQDEVSALLSGSAQTDVLLMHDWPSGIVKKEDMWRFRSPLPGNEYLRLIVESRKPKLVLCGHMHFSYRSVVNEGDTAVCCLGRIGQNRHAVAVFQYQEGMVYELNLEKM